MDGQNINNVVENGHLAFHELVEQSRELVEKIGESIDDNLVVAADFPQLFLLISNLEIGKTQITMALSHYFTRRKGVLP